MGVQLRAAQVGALRTVLTDFEDQNDTTIAKVNIAGKVVVSSLAANRLVYIEPNGRFRAGGKDQ